MKSTQHITLTNPCHEDWDNMSVTDRGRYCAACQKTVIDFTLMTDGQVLDIFKKAKDNTPCGRFLNTQLERPLIDARYKPSFAAILAKRFAATVLLFQSLATAALAQQVKKTAPTTKHVQKVPLAAKPIAMIKGRITDVTCNASLAGVEISVKGADIKTMTDSAGAFTLKLPDATSYNMPIVLVGSQDGFFVEDVTTTLAAIKNEVVVMQRQKKLVTQVADIVSISPAVYQIMGGAISIDAARANGNMYVIDGVEVPMVKQSLWKRITKPFRKKHKTNEPG